MSFCIYFNVFVVVFSYFSMISFGCNFSCISFFVNFNSLFLKFIIKFVLLFIFFFCDCVVIIINFVVGCVIFNFRTIIVASFVTNKRFKWLMIILFMLFGLRDVCVIFDNCLYVLMFCIIVLLSLFRCLCLFYVRAFVR